MGAYLRLENVGAFIIILILSLASIIIGTVWVLGETLGESIPPSVWLIILGFLGICGLLGFLGVLFLRDR